MKREFTEYLLDFYSKSPIVGTVYLAVDRHWRPN